MNGFVGADESGGQDGDLWKSRAERKGEGDDANGQTLLKGRGNTKRSKSDQRVAEAVEQPDKAKRTGGTAEEPDWTDLTGFYKSIGERETYK